MKKSLNYFKDKASRCIKDLNDDEDEKKWVTARKTERIGSTERWITGITRH